MWTDQPTNWPQSDRRVPGGFDRRLIGGTDLFSLGNVNWVNGRRCERDDYFAILSFVAPSRWPIAIFDGRRLPIEIYYRAWIRQYSGCP